MFTNEANAFLNIFSAFTTGPFKTAVLQMIALFVAVKGLEFALTWLVSWIKRKMPGHQQELWKDWKG